MGHPIADTRQQTPDTSDGGYWLPLGQAARKLGVAERTIRRHIDAGRYHARRRGREVLVLLPHTGQGTPDGAHRAFPLVAPTADRRQGTPVTTDTGHAATDRAVAVLERLLDEERADLVRERQARGQVEQVAAMWQERARNLEAQVEQLLALPAHEEPESRRFWWRFWRR